MWWTEPGWGPCRKLDPPCDGAAGGGRHCRIACVLCLAAQSLIAVVGVLCGPGSLGAGITARRPRSTPPSPPHDTRDLQRAAAITGNRRMSPSRPGLDQAYGTFVSGVSYICIAPRTDSILDLVYALVHSEAKFVFLPKG